MPNPTLRRFTVIDGMVLVAALAVGLFLGRKFGSRVFVIDADPDNRITYLVCLALSVNLALLALSLMHPRPPRREWAAQPGVSAGLAVVMSFAFFILYGVGTEGIEHGFEGVNEFVSRVEDEFEESLEYTYTSSLTFGAVGSVWISTALVGAWRAEKTWLDRAGRVLGIFWLFLWTVYWSKAGQFLHK